MSYSTSNPPVLITQRVGDVGGGIWSYDSADAATSVRAANYITDALDLGMKKGDTMFQHDSAGATVAHIYPVLAVASSGADLGDGTAIDVTNS